MKTAEIKGGLTFSYPNNFVEMSKDELRKAYGPLDFRKRAGFRDENTHMLFVVQWKDEGKLFSKPVDDKSTIERSEKQLSQFYHDKNYELVGFFTTQVAGREAQGLTHRYHLMDLDQQATIVAFHTETTSYMVYYYTRPERVEENQPIYDQIMASMKLA